MVRPSRGINVVVIVLILNHYFQMLLKHGGFNGVIRHY